MNAVNSADLDPQPFVHQNIGEAPFRDRESCPGCAFQPRPEYSQNSEDYS